MKAGWTSKALGEVCAIDKVPGHHAGLPYVGLENIEPGTSRFLPPIDEPAVTGLTFKFTPSHILYGRLRPYLNKVMAPEFPGRCSTEIMPLRPGPELSRTFLLYWLRTDDTVSQINATCTGTRMPRANMDRVLELSIAYPPIAEQRRIVGILDQALGAIDSAKGNVQRNVRNARALFASYLEEVFRRGTRHWVCKPLLDLCHIKHGFAFRSEFFSDEGPFILLTPGNFFESGGYRDRGDKQKFYCGEVPTGFVLAEGDLLVAMTEQAPGLLGSPIIVPASGTFLHNQRLGLVTKKPGVTWTNEFFFHVFNTPAVRAEIHASASGVKVRHTSPAKIGAVRVSFPATEAEQRSVAAALKAANEGIARLQSLSQRKLAALDELKKSLLHQAFTGQL